MFSRQIRFDEKSPVRVASMVVVLLVHLAGLLWISMPSAPWRSLRGGKRSSSGRELTVRLISRRSPKTGHADIRGFGPKPLAPRRKRTSRHQQAVVHRSSRASATRHPEPATRPLDLSLPANAGKSQAQVGRTLGPALSAPHLRLPGGGHVAGAPHLHVVDPRTQGLAGATHFLRHLFGMVSSHCVDVDTWRGMSREERFRHHITDEQIRRTATYYGCSSASGQGSSRR